MSGGLLERRKASLGAIVGAYDVRGRVSEELSDDVVFALGWAVGTVMAARFKTESVIIGHDMRGDSARFAALLACGIHESGCESVRLGMCSTDQLYFASGRWQEPGLMVTASHNPAEYNGIKVCGPGALGIARDDLLGEIRDTAARAPELPGLHADRFGTYDGAARQLAGDYALAIRSMTGLDRLTEPVRLRVLADCGNGMAGKLVGEVFGEEAGLSALPITVDTLFPEPDGTFPNHPANPLDPANLTDVTREVTAGGYDLGLAFDGDADRCFFIDERGIATSASAVGALVATREVARAKARGESVPVVLHNALTTMSVPRAIAAAGGRPIRTKVGHSGIKQLMRTEGAIFAAEHSAHFYFRDFSCADSGMLAACHIIAALIAEKRPLSVMLAPFNPVSTSGEINSEVADPDTSIRAVRDRISAGDFGAGEIDELDGVTFSGPGFWFNVRKSNTEPLVRFNAETQSAGHTRELTERVLHIIRSQ